MSCKDCKCDDVEQRNKVLERALRNLNKRLLEVDCTKCPYVEMDCDDYDDCVDIFIEQVEQELKSGA